MKYLLDGYGGANGSPYALQAPIFQTGSVLYVSSVSGDASEASATDRAAPQSTLAGAIALASAGDTIVLLEDHDEEVTTTIVVNKNLTIVGEGLADGNPTASLTGNFAAGGTTISVDGARLEIHNVKFPEQLQGTAANNRHILCETDGQLWAEDCYFEQGEFSGIGVRSGMSGDVLRNCKFVSVATSLATRGAEGYSVGATRVRLEGCVFDGGTYGFFQVGGTTYAAEVGAATGVNFLDCSLLRGADLFVNAGAGQVRLHIPTITGGARVVY